MEVCQLLTEDNSMKTLPWSDSHKTNAKKTPKLYKLSCN